ncbi:unnamed protein product [Trypanosoma congolense IL3000]|nr:unnamed protein product [Trypanosoma congolense IL3000]
MRTDPLLVNGRVIFPLAHPLLHVWYALHRQAIVAAANNAQALLQMQSTAVISSNSTEAATGWRSRELSANELRRRQMQAQRRCERALRMLRRISGWAILPLTQAVEVESSDVLKEWMWFQSIRFKLLIRRVRLLRIVGTFDACNRALEETCEQLRLLRSQDEMLCRSVEVQRLMDDVFNQITREKLLLRDEGAQKGGLVLRV